MNFILLVYVVVTLCLPGVYTEYMSVFCNLYMLQVDIG